MWGPRALKASSGPYAEEERPSAPRPTQARKAISDTLWKTPGSWSSRFRPRNHRPIRRVHGREPPKAGSGRPDRGRSEEGNGELGGSSPPAGTRISFPMRENRLKAYDATPILVPAPL